MEAAAALDPDVVRAVDHHLCDRVVGERALQRAVAEDVVRDLLSEPLAVLAGDARLLLEPATDVGGHAVAHRRRVGVGSEQLGTEFADDSEVDAVLDLVEAVAGAPAPAGRAESLLKVQGRYLRLTGRRRRPLEDACRSRGSP